MKESQLKLITSGLLITAFISYLEGLIIPPQNPDLQPNVIQIIHFPDSQTTGTASLASGTSLPINF